ncbi:prolyl oligopeptidase family serine peptidase [Amycolatopsis sp. NPDC059021]|uniref:prolyl oligopeptidase family serine peptidase n=1 Tax=Amycolatopsis sp. NPDC059021 TaxID=3346704 RepID=UPI00366EFBD8
MAGQGSGVPSAPRQHSVRELHGEQVVDDYAWMRDHDDPRLMEYLVAEREYFDAYVGKLGPLVDRLMAESAGRDSSGGAGFTWRVGDFEYFLQARDGSRHPRYARRSVATGETEVVLDLEVLGAGREFTRIGVFEPSPDGTLLAYSVDHVGYESYQLRFRDLRTGEDLPRTREGTYYTGAWNADSSVFCYVVHDPAMRPYQVLAHSVGAPAGQPDRLLWSEDDEHFNTILRTTRDREWIVISNQSRTTAEELLVPAGDVGTPPRPVLPRKHGRWYFTEHQRGPGLDRFVMLLCDGREERRLLGTATAETAGAEWSELVPVDPRLHRQRLDVFAEGLLVSGYRDGTTVFELFGIDGTRHEFSPANPAGCLLIEGRRDATRVQLDNRTAYDSGSVVLTEQSLVDPPVQHRIDLRTGAREVVGTTVVTGYDPARYRTERFFATSHDGVAIPVTIAYRADVTPDGGNPCLLYCYGAYERPWEPVFSGQNVSLLDRGFVYAIAHVRGGGELGRAGWLDGSMAAKQNSAADLISVRDHLVAQGWAHPGKVVCHGSCAGGIPVGQAYTDHPELWAGVLAEAPAVDLLNAMLDEKLPLTVNEWEEWGDPRDEEIYRLMRRYVAYENVSGRARPPLLVTAFYNDPRVMVHEPARWTAALRAADTDGNRVLLRTELGDGGHHGPSTSDQVARGAAEVLAFVIDAGSGG